LLSVEWKIGCLTTAYCARPQFRLTTTNHASTESNSITWLVTEDIVQVSNKYQLENADQARPFISHWIRGEPSDLSVACEIIGADPKYGFQRTCDFTPTVAIFREYTENNTSQLTKRSSVCC
uniref:FBA_2 domain-containing protein n=1 Tax=Anisakis simplex TaxID=6269 RepID=A0A0M3JFU3_ANISI